MTTTAKVINFINHKIMNLAHMNLELKYGISYETQVITMSIQFSCNFKLYLICLLCKYVSSQYYKKMTFLTSAIKLIDYSYAYSL